MLELKNVTKIFNKGNKNELYALKNVSLAVPDKDMLGIMGRSGSGKSTLLNIISFLNPHTSGNYIFDGIDSNTINKSKQNTLRATKIGVLLQDFGLIETETAINNVMLPMYFN
ncbi:MAG: ATP-binding cassette domain-containing protein, partial [Oscillospiraceae bacterium]|nr:ATP-binding cassette domain-containing protein [Oscillospiraceae bacterium]